MMPDVPPPLRSGGNAEKSLQLKESRGNCFEDIVYHIEKGDILADYLHPDQKKYPGQRIMISGIDNYAYLIPYVEDAEEGKQHFAKYKEWLSSLGDSAVSPANPFKNTRTVNSNGTVTTGSTTSMSGYTIIKADSMETALEIAKACPFLDIGGSLEVSELLQMPG